jgi:hypothetical protein
MTDLANQIKAQLTHYVDGKIAQTAFDNWFALAILEAHRTGDSEAESLLHSIEWELADVERGVLSIDDAKARLSSLLSLTADVQSPDATGLNTVLSEVATSMPTRSEGANRINLIETQMTFSSAGA